MKVKDIIEKSTAETIAIYYSLDAFTAENDPAILIREGSEGFEHPEDAFSESLWNMSVRCINVSKYEGIMIYVGRDEDDDE